MADYKELLRKAVQALPENNGASRRAVYEKARSALVGQLRAINPPLPARDITAHRLQLEDCIRQVEQEASEAVIAGMQDPPGFRPDPPPTQPARLETRPQGKAQPAPVELLPPEPNSIEEIIAAAEAALPPVQSKAAPKPPTRTAATARNGVARNSTRAKAAAALAPDPEPTPESKKDPEPKPEFRPEPKPEPKAAPKPSGKAARPLPSIVARAEAARTKTIPPTPLAAVERPPEGGGHRGPSIEPRRQAAVPLRAEPGLRVAASRQAAAEPATLANIVPAVAAAMSAVREVDVETPPPADPQGAIDRAIATLDREARGETVPPAEPRANGKAVEAMEAAPAEERIAPAPERRRGGMGISVPGADARRSRPERGTVFERGDKQRPRRDAPRREVSFQRPREERGVSAVTIFLGVFVALVVAVGGAGIWAWQEGYLNLNSMFAQGEPGQQEAVVPQVPAAGAAPTASAPTAIEAATTVASAPVVAEERLQPDPTVSAAAVQPMALVAASPEPPAPASEERLPVDASPSPQPAPSTDVAAIDPAQLAGSQSLLLEAGADGSVSAVPFSGSVEWSKGTDEIGAPTLVGKASIPARSLMVDILIRKNSDTTLPASHLMEISFSVSDTFVGGSIATLPGVLLKNEELVQGTPLKGASARVTSNSFLFALSATAEDKRLNYDLLTSQRWMDLAIIYATSKRALLTLEKDDKADQLFKDVFAAWGPPPAASAQ